MGYMKIANLSKDNRILNTFKRCYALEKLHGTSSHLIWNKGEIGFFGGGAGYEPFKKLFDAEGLTASLKAFFPNGLPDKLVVYGEAYGGKMQAMSETYGKNLRFAAFDVAVNDRWVSVPYAEAIVKALGLEFVAYEEVSCDLETLNAHRDMPSRQAIRNGCGSDKMAEGIVIRPLIEFDYPNGERVIAKHKRPEFSERKSKKDTDPTKQAETDTAEKVAEEWVVLERVRHVADRMRGALNRDLDMPDIRDFIAAMVEDVIREGEGEVEDTKPNRRAIGNLAALMYKKIVLVAHEG
jgi:RNA ligase